MDSGYGGPEEVVEIRVGGRALRLARPADPDRLLEDPTVLAWNAADDYMPYWAYLWPGAYLLAESAAGEAWEGGVAALELGCGLGLAGLAALAAGCARVDFTDYDEAPLRFVRRTMAANGFGEDRFTTERIDWREPPDRRYRAILGADVLYERRLVPLVVDLLAQMLEPDGFALVAGPYRVATEDLEPALRAAGLQSTSTAVHASREDGKPLRGTLHRITRDSSAASR